MFDLARAGPLAAQRARPDAAESPVRATPRRRTLVVGPADDRAEREADAVAASVVDRLRSSQPDKADDVAASVVDQLRSSDADKADAGLVGAPTGRIHRASGATARPPAVSRAPSRIQRMPADFANHEVLTIPAKTGLFRTSHWASIQEAVRKYSTLTLQDVPQRRALLREMATYIARWIEARGLHADKSFGDLDADERRKYFALSSLRQLIDFEHRTIRDPELKASAGELAVDRPRHPLPNPALTRRRVEKDKRERGFLAKAVRLLDDAGRRQRETVPAQTVCRVLVKDAGPAGKPASRYYWIRPAPAEDSRFGPVREFSPGFVERSAVIVSNLERDDPSLRYEKRFSPTQFPLFQGPPKVEDVEQAALADCFLMAAVLAIVRRDPTFFVRAMKDHGDGVVSVRLYDIVEQGGSPKPAKTFRPRIVHVEKSVVVRTTRPTVLDEGYNKGATWVQMLEKAYAAAGYTGSHTQRLPSRTMTWAQIEGGHAHIALEHLTGVPAELTPVSTSDYGTMKQNRTWATKSADLMDWLGDTGRSAAWFSQLCYVFEDELIKLHNEHDEVRKEDVFALLDRTVQDTELREDIKEFIDYTKLYPGRRGSGAYTADQLALFVKVARALAAGKLVVLESKQSMKRTGGAHTGTSGGEHKYAGLAGPHGYEVSDFAPHDYATRADALLWLKVRNPWGTYGRTYVDKSTNAAIRGGDPTRPSGPMHAVADESRGEFWIELADVTKRFFGVVIQ